MNMYPQLATLLHERLGAVRLVEIERAGIPHRIVRQLLNTGELVKRRRGVVQDPRVTEHWAQLRSEGFDLSCVNAASKMGLWVLNKRVDELHLSYRRTAQVPDKLLVPGRAGMVITAHRRRTNNRTLDTVLHAMHCLPEIEALVIAESAIVLKKLGLDELREAARVSRSVKEHKIIECIQPGSMSLLETTGRYHLVAAGHHVQIQKYYPEWGHLDGLIDGILGIEFDGREFHDNAIGYQEDRRRNNSSVLQGVPTLRVTYDLVVHRPKEFIALVEKALAQARRGKFM